MTAWESNTGNRAVIKISSCWANDISRQGIQQLGILFGSIFRLFSFKSSGVTFIIGGKNQRPLTLYREL